MNQGRGFTAIEVDALFRRASIRGPWFSEDACDGLASILNELFQPDGDVPEISPSARSSQPLTREARKRRLDAYRVLEAATTLSSPDLTWTTLAEEKALRQLMTAMEAARPYIIGREWPRRRTWLVRAIVLAGIVADFMRDAGHHRIGTNRNSSLARFLELILPRFMDLAEEAPQREAIAACLNEKNVNGLTLASLIERG